MRAVPVLRRGRGGLPSLALRARESLRDGSAGAADRLAARGRHWFRRYRPALAVAGAILATAQVLWWFSLGAWPPHDTANIWLAGHRLIAGEPVYTGLVTGFLVFVYSPPIAVLAAPLSVLPLNVLSVAMLVGQILALRWIAGSWLNAALLGWLPWVPRELVTGNVDLLLAAAIYAGCRALPRSGIATALFMFMKFSPAIATRRWVEFGFASAGLVAITVPWLHLWPEWFGTIIGSLGMSFETVPLLPRLVLSGILVLVVRAPWARAAAAGLATPAFYPGHSLVLLLPAARLLLGSSADAASPEPRSSTADTLAASDRSVAA